MTDSLSETPPAAAPSGASSLPAYIGVPDETYQAPQRYAQHRTAGVAMDRGTPRPIVDRSSYVLPYDATPQYQDTNSPNAHVASPLYRQGAQYTLIAGMPDEQIAAIQREMVAAGLVSGRVVLGVWDDNSAAAASHLMAIANVQGLKFADALDQAVAHANDPGNVINDTSAARAPLTIQLTNPDDLKNVFNQTAEAVYGRRLPDEDLNTLVGSFNQLESQYQTQTYGQQETGGTSTSPPTAQTFAESQLRSMNPGLAGATDLANTFDNFTKLIGAAGSG